MDDPNPLRSREVRLGLEYRKKPLLIEAVQYTGQNGAELRAWSGGAVVVSPVLEPTPTYPAGAYVQIQTPEGTMTAGVGDWILRGVQGEYYPCKNDIFLASYEAAERAP